jgi:ATP-binding cassette subfamily B protein
MSLYSFVMKNVKKQRIIFILCAVINTLVALIEPVCMPIITGKFVDALYNNQPITQWIILYIIGMFAWSLYFVLEYVFFSPIFPQLERNIRTDLLDHIYKLPMDIFNQKTEGEIARSISMISDNIKFLVEKIIVRTIPFMVAVIAIIIKFFMVNFMIGIVLVIWIILHGWITYYNYKDVSCKNAMEAGSHLKTNGFIMDCFKNRLIIEIRYLYEIIKQKLDIYQDKEQNNHINSQKSITLSRLIQCIFIFVFLGIISNGILIYLYRNNHISGGDFIIIFGLIGSAINIVWRLVERLPEIFQAWAKCKPGAKLLEISTVESKNLVIQNPKGHIIVNDLTINYDNQNELFHNISFEVFPGEILVIIGESGCGKTSVINAIYGITQPQSGKILLDNHDVFQLNHKFKSQYFNYINVKKVLFFDTIKNNLFCDNDEKIHKLLELTCLTDKINELPNGINTIINNNSSSLSEGQCQRINICRSIVNYELSSILLMDEPLNGLDEKTANIVLSNLLNLYENKTIIAIDHGLKIFPYAHKILFFHKNEVLFGTKEEIMNHESFQNYLKLI